MSRSIPNASLKSSTDVLAMLHDTAKTYGIPELATKMGIPRGTLWNKLSLTEANIHHKTSLAEFIQIMAITQDITPLISLNALFGCATYPIADLSIASDSALLDLLNRVHIEGGTFHSELHQALQDGVITSDEFKRIESQVFSWLSAIVEMGARIKGMVKDAAD